LRTTGIDRQIIISSRIQSFWAFDNNCGLSEFVKYNLSLIGNW